jgi:rhodanese-related sulfurtransferase
VADPYAHGGVLLDVRTREETSHGHFPSALLIPIDELAESISAVHARAGGFNRPILVMCRLGRRAERGVAILRHAGFTNVCNIGGLEVEPLRSMTHGLVGNAERTPQQWGEYGLDHHQRCYQRWLHSLYAGPPDYNALVGAYRHAYGAEMNLRDAADDRWQAAQHLRRRMATQLEAAMRA